MREGRKRQGMCREGNVSERIGEMGSRWDDYMSRVETEKRNIRLTYTR